MKKSSVSRRKFLANMGLATGAAALAASVKVNAISMGNRNLLDAWSRPASLRNPWMEPVKILNRKAGTCKLPLARRPY